MDFEMFHPDLEPGLNDADGARGGHPPGGTLMVLKILIIQAPHNLTDDRAEFRICDRPSFMSFLGLRVHHRLPDIAIPSFGEEAHPSIERRTG
ncbi:MAG: transposase [Pseudomonadota bacterium]